MDDAVEIASDRIIPADAGSTCSALSARCSPWDHPRGCGEHKSVELVFVPVAGSSPRMRGAHPNHHPRSDSRRIIPADAGSTCPVVRMIHRRKDHPRGCGEHTDSICEYCSMAGSSPRMRGAHKHGEKIYNLPGIIPADAGSTPRGSGSWRRRADHPRGCGEHAGP